MHMHLLFHQEALQRVFNGVMASSVFTNVFFAFLSPKTPPMTSPRCTAVVLTTRRPPQDFCQHGCRQWAAPHVFVHECEQAICQRPPLRSEWWWGKFLGQKAFIICYVVYVCPSQEEAFKGMFEVRDVSLFKVLRVFQCTGIPIDLFLWVWEQFRVNRT